jgi:pentose-5-phosphate-3-epimerase
MANVAEVAATGADLVVTGSAVFDGRSPGQNAAFMLAQMKPQGLG